MSASDESQDVYVCAHCQTGSLRARRVTLAAWFEDQFITVPRFPAWVCDLCGACEYDAGALEQLEAILGPEANLRRGRTPAPRRASGPPALARLNPRRFV